MLVDYGFTTSDLWQPPARGKGLGRNATRCLPHTMLSVGAGGPCSARPEILIAPFVAVVFRARWLWPFLGGRRSGRSLRIWPMWLNDAAVSRVSAGCGPTRDAPRRREGGHGLLPAMVWLGASIYRAFNRAPRRGARGRGSFVAVLLGSPALVLGAAAPRVGRGLGLRQDPADGSVVKQMSAALWLANGAHLVTKHLGLRSHRSHRVGMDAALRGPSGAWDRTKQQPRKHAVRDTCSQKNGGQRVFCFRESLRLGNLLGAAVPYFFVGVAGHGRRDLPSIPELQPICLVVRLKHWTACAALARACLQQLMDNSLH